jgi:hypothetical protein
MALTAVATVAVALDAVAAWFGSWIAQRINRANLEPPNQRRQALNQTLMEAQHANGQQRRGGEENDNDHYVGNDR